ncbi:hypothetical protein WJX74_006403 [Apatococcus lobatus]|uniref:Uncharacterized protein n=1 Tax=Apatococcus lobatus TaxID=904363 RepID=A0AAW1RYN6_9CHLO
MLPLFWRQPQSSVLSEQSPCWASSSHSQHLCRNHMPFSAYKSQRIAQTHDSAVTPAATCKLMTTAGTLYKQTLLLRNAAAGHC